MRTWLEKVWGRSNSKGLGSQVERSRGEDAAGERVADGCFMCLVTKEQHQHIPF